MKKTDRLDVSFRGRKVGSLALTTDGTGHPKLSDFITVGLKIKIPETRCREIICEVAAGCTGLTRYALK